MSDQGIAFLRKALDAAMDEVRKTGATPAIIIFDEEDEATKYDNALTAAQYSKEIDGMLSYRVYGKEWTLTVRGPTAVFSVLYQGGYDKDSAAEIIFDCNEAGEAVLKPVNAAWDAA